MADRIASCGNTRRTFSTNEVAQAFGVTGRTVASWLQIGQLNAICIPNERAAVGKRAKLWWRIKPSHVAEMCERLDWDVPELLTQAEIIQRAYRMLAASDCVEINDAEALKKVLISIL